MTRLLQDGHQTAVSVRNPARRAVDQELRKARAEIKKIQEIHGATALKHVQVGIATLRALSAEENKIHRELNAANDQVQKLRAQQKSLPSAAVFARPRCGLMRSR